MKTHGSATALLVVGAAMLSACSTVEQVASDTADAAACAVVLGIAGQVRGIADEAAAGATTQELQQRAEALQISAEGLGAAVESLSPEVAGSLQLAADAFKDAAANVPSDAAGAVADEAFGAAAARYQSAIDDAVAALGC